MQNWYELGPFTVFDLETTGMRPKSDRIVEIAAVRIDLDGSRQAFSSLVNPSCPIPPGASRVHGITDDMVADAPYFYQIGTDFLDFASGSVLVAHNARFDLSFLQESLAREALGQWEGKTMDSLRLCRKVLPGLPSYGLQNLRRSLALPDPEENMQAHRAGADVGWTVLLLERLLSELIARS